MTPDEARELRHELRTPVNHLIGYAELLLEEDDASASDAQSLEVVRTLARQVLELVPGLLDDGRGGFVDDVLAVQAESSARSIASLIERVEQLESLTAGLAATSSLPAVDI